MTGLLRRFLIALSDRSPAFTPTLVGIVSREAGATNLLADAVAAAIKTEGWHGDIGPAVKAVTVASLRRDGDHAMADAVEALPCHIHIEGRE